MKLVFASNNAHKLEEVCKILPDIEIVSLREVGFHSDIDETGTTLEENSHLKAQTIWDWLVQQDLSASYDGVFADDTGHVCGFKYFNEFRKFAELSDVLTGKVEGRTNDEERILSYNIGLGLHDLIYADKIFDMLQGKVQDFELNRETQKFWI